MFINIKDSLMYYIETDDLYQDRFDQPHLINLVNTSNLPSNHACFTLDCWKISTYLTGETNGSMMLKFVALRTKSYACVLEGETSIKTKRICRIVVRNHLIFEDHKKYFFGDDEDEET